MTGADDGPAGKPRDIHQPRVYLGLQRHGRVERDLRGPDRAFASMVACASCARSWIDDGCEGRHFAELNLTGGMASTPVISHMRLVRPIRRRSFAIAHLRLVVAIGCAGVRHH